ncbi:sodium/proline symporter [Saccharobesus litoralis]|uniref:Sodium/proline symporter n=1 Tax=Saccharobesus litoralis TaxID=2172099 RepID=A0A2S0VLN2_9ALTE|nr:sodium/proline symporter [Saccharobesus litoralis]AWB65113.1 sodium/proline symporter [Saccharobesus litoralis]
MLLPFLLCLLAITAIGLSSARKSQQTKKDYYLASASVKPWLVGLSAVATNNSGYMFIGVIGYTYSAGLSAIWLMFGWILGDYVASLYVHRKVKVASQISGQVSYAGMLSNWYQQDHINVQKLIAILSFCFLITYAAAQLVAGSKALHVLLGWPLWSGAVVGAILVCAYCFSGGIRASIWTDAVQSFVMVFAMTCLLAVALLNQGGFSQAYAQMANIPNYLDWFPQDLFISGAAGMVVFVLSWFVAGFSVIGQPHIMVRFMALDSEHHIKQARAWYYVWFVIFYSFATCVGLLSRLYIPDISTFDAELALPTMAMVLLPPALVGMVLAGIFAATLSTADSLLLSCSSAVTHDLSNKKTSNTIWLKLTTVFITGCALGIALMGNNNVFDMVILAWSGLASAFAPLLIVLCLGLRPQQNTCLIAIIVGFITALLWRINELHQAVYEGLPGILAGLLVFTLAGIKAKRGK